MNAYDEEYDVVIDTLQKKIDALWNMTQANMNADMMNIMDDIRLEQIDELKKAIELWKNRNEESQD
jgi:hypothetical protein